MREKKRSGKKYLHVLRETDNENGGYLLATGGLIGGVGEVERKGGEAWRSVGLIGGGGDWDGGEMGAIWGLGGELDGGSGILVVRRGIRVLLVWLWVGKGLWEEGLGLWGEFIGDGWWLRGTGVV